MTVDQSENQSGTKADSAAFLWFFAGVLVLLYLLLYLAPLNQRPLFTPDESRYAEIPWEMLANRDWATLHQVGLPYYEKPPLGYWLTAATQYVFGHNSFAVRLPSALAAGLTALALFLLLRRVRKNYAPALAAAAVYLSCLEVFGVGTFAVLDSLFTLFVCLSLIAYYLSLTGTGRRRLMWAILSGVACGLAFLSKGLTALVLPALTACAWLLWERRYRDLLTSWIIPVAVAGLTVLPAALLLHRANPDFWRYFFWVEHVQRFLDPHGGQHRESFFFYLPIIAAGAVPWTFLMPGVYGEVRSRLREDSLSRYCLAWFVSQFLFFSACGGKLPTYILPGFLPLALLLGEALIATSRGAWLARGAWLGAVIFAAAIVGFLVWLPFSNQVHLRESLAGDSESWLLGAALVVAALCLFMASRRFSEVENEAAAAASRRRLAGIGWTALTLATAAFASFFALPEGIEDRKSPSRLLEDCIPLTPAGAEILSDRKTIASVCWHYRREDVKFFGEKGELAYGLESTAAAGRYFPTAGEAAAWLEITLAGGAPVVLCLRDDALLELEKYARGRKPAERRELSHYVWALYLPDRVKD